MRNVILIQKTSLLIKKINKLIFYKNTQMKKITNKILITLILVMNINNGNAQSIVTKDEVTDLTILREEEKLARDVYLYAYDVYGLKIFKNISGSEQKHMDKVFLLLNKFGIPDPATAEKGVFHNTELQKLYNDLTAKVDLSLVDALLVGATIEDLDIFDINEFEKRTTNPILLNVYSKLKCGSKNHMRAFTKQLKKKKITYEPQYISNKLYKEIIKGSNESCGKGKSKEMMKGKGKGMGKGRGQGMGRGMHKNTW